MQIDKQQKPRASLDWRADPMPILFVATFAKSVIISNFSEMF